LLVRLSTGCLRYKEDESVVARSNAAQAAPRPFEPAPSRILTPTAVSPDSVYDGAFGRPARQLQLQLEKTWTSHAAAARRSARWSFATVLFTNALLWVALLLSLAKSV
jgi:hypothetical protein